MGYTPNSDGYKAPFIFQSSGRGTSATGQEEEKPLSWPQLLGSQRGARSDSVVSVLLPRPCHRRPSACLSSVCKSACLGRGVPLAACHRWKPLQLHSFSSSCA